jgi:hypothetical protein
LTPIEREEPRQLSPHTIFKSELPALIFKSSINAVIDGITINSSTPATATTHPIRGRFIGVYCSNAWRNGLSVIEGHQLDFIGCEFSNTTGSSPQAGVDLEPNGGDPANSIDGIRFYGCTFQGSVGYGMQISTNGSPKNIVIDGCRFTANAAGGINVNSTDIRITKNLFEAFTASTRGIVDVGASASNKNILIDGNTFLNITAANQMCVYVHSLALNVTISNNRFLSVVNGVQAYGVRTIIRGNYFDTWSQIAINNPGGTAHFQIVANHFFMNGGGGTYSIYVETGGDYCLISDNILIDCENAAPASGSIRMRGAHATIVNNVLRLATTPDAAASAIRIDSDADIVKGNVINGYSTTVGISFIGLTDAANTITSCHSENRTDGASPQDLVKFQVGGKKWFAGTAAPGTGTWAVGDIVWNTAPAHLGTIGWCCTAAGTPGTWFTFGVIS